MNYGKGGRVKRGKARVLAETFIPAKFFRGQAGFSSSAEDPDFWRGVSVRPTASGDFAAGGTVTAIFTSGFFSVIFKSAVFFCVKSEVKPNSLLLRRMAAALSGLIPLMAAPARAGLGNPAGLWQLNGNLNPALSGFSPLDASTLASPADYSFATDGPGYSFVLLQPFATAAKRLTVTNPTGSNGGSGATRTNQWTVVMDVKFDSFAPYAGVLQLDPANAADVTFYMKPEGDGTTGTMVCPSGNLGATGAITRNVWYRLALTCGNNGAAGAPTVQLYVNGTPSGGALATTFNGPMGLQSTFHLFSDNNGELRPVRLGFLGLWGEALSAADVARLGAPAPAGVSAAALAYPPTPAQWGTWTEDVYYGFSPKMISAASDPDGRLRAAFVNNRSLAGTTSHSQVLMMTYRRADGGFRQSEFVNLRSGTPATTPYTSATGDDYASGEAGSKNLRTKIVTADTGDGNFTVKARMISDFQQAPNGLAYVYRGKMISPPAPFPLFPRAAWSRGPDYTETVYGNGSVISIADSVGLSAAGSVTAVASASDSTSLSVSISPIYKIAGQTLTAPTGPTVGSGTQKGRVFSLDSALTDDGKDAYHLVSYAMFTGKTANNVPIEIDSRLALIRQRITSPTAAGTVSSAYAAKVISPDTSPNSVLSNAKILLTHATGEPKWIVWSDSYSGDVQAAKRVIPLPDGPADDTNQLRRINGGYSTPITLDTFSSGSDAALDSMDRLHVVWRGFAGAGAPTPVHYARENSAGGFDEIVLPTPTSGPPAIAIGPGDYPYIVYAGVTASNPNESAPLIVALPPGLITSYRGDYEDRDGDGRPGLIERAQGSNDTVVETGIELRAIALSPTMTAVTPTDRRFEMGFQLAGRTVRTPGSAGWALADGMDTLMIQPAWSFDDMKTFYTGGFDVIDDFTISGRGRYVSVRDVSNSLFHPRQFYRLQVKRVPPSP